MLGQLFALAAHDGVFVVGSLPRDRSPTASGDRYDVIGAAACLVGVAVIMFAPRAGVPDA